MDLPLDRTDLAGVASLAAEVNAQRLELDLDPIRAQIAQRQQMLAGQ